jgi:hypothetical protein
MGRNATGGGEANPKPTVLAIAVTPGGESPTKLWTLRCPSGGTLPRPTRTCRRLLQLDDPFAPVPTGVACTEVYGGPQVAEVHGRYRGEQVDARFSRTNGCEIARWNKVRFLFPGT